jgi:hypothetical protein
MIPEEVLKVVQETMHENLSNPSRAAEEAERRIGALPNFKDLVPYLLRYAIQSLVHEARMDFGKAETKRLAREGRRGIRSAGGV